MTAEAFIAMPQPPNRRPWNLVDGEVVMKRAVYEAAGLPELWLVDTASASVLVHRRSTPEQALFDISLELGLGENLGSPLFPEFALAVDSVFPASS